MLLCALLCIPWSSKIMLSRSQVGDLHLDSLVSCVMSYDYQKVQITQVKMSTLIYNPYVKLIWNISHYPGKLMTNGQKQKCPDVLKFTKSVYSMHMIKYFKVFAKLTVPIGYGIYHKQVAFLKNATWSIAHFTNFYSQIFKANVFDLHCTLRTKVIFLCPMLDRDIFCERKLN